MFLFLGLEIWKKQKIQWIHSYHHMNVSMENKQPYTKRIGKALVLMSIGTFLTGIIDVFTKTLYGWIAFGVFFIMGLVLMMKAQLKYNGGIFS